MQVRCDYAPEGAAILEEESVAIRKEDWLSINKAIADALDKAIAPLKPRGWRNAVYLLREWGVLGAIAALIVALLGITAVAFYQATARIEKEATFQTNTERDLQELSLIHI